VHNTISSEEVRQECGVMTYTDKRPRQKDQIKNADSFHCFAIAMCKLGDVVRD
jgi:hypothetical protein